MLWKLGIIIKKLKFDRYLIKVESKGKKLQATKTFIELTSSKCILIENFIISSCFSKKWKLHIFLKNLKNLIFDDKFIYIEYRLLSNWMTHAFILIFDVSDDVFNYNL